MTARHTLYVLVSHGVVAALVVLSSTALAWHGSLDAPTVAVIYGSAIGLAGGAASSLGSLGSVVNGKTVVTAEALEQREQTLRASIKSNQDAIQRLSESSPPQN